MPHNLPRRPMNPDEPMPDDSVCCQCRKALPDNPEPGSWNDSGFCGAPCALAFHLTFAEFPHDPGTGSVLTECIKALSEITNKHYYKCDRCGYLYEATDEPPSIVTG